MKNFYTNNCSDCIFLGNYEGVNKYNEEIKCDLYYCKEQNVTVVIYNENDYNYKEGILEDCENDIEDNPELLEARKLALEYLQKK